MKELDLNFPNQFGSLKTNKNCKSYSNYKTRCQQGTTRQNSTQNLLNKNNNKMKIKIKINNYYNNIYNNNYYYTNYYYKYNYINNGQYNDYDTREREREFLQPKNAQHL